MKREEVTIAVDAMGGDYAPQAAVDGAVLAAADGARLLLVGQEEVVRRELARAAGRASSTIEVVHAEEVVEMDEAPISPIRRKRRSSIRICAELVKEGRAQAMVSAGNTGAAMIAAKMVIGTVEGVDRPALASVFPNRKSSTLLLDVGANIDSKAEQLREFAIMGHFFYQDMLGEPSPRIGLLSIGEEDAKGTDLTREVFQMIGSAELNFVGNVEGRDLFDGSVDVVVCDGFVGNALIKASESLGEMIAGFLREEMQQSWRTKLGYLLARPAFDRFSQRVDYSEYGAAPLLGLRGGCFIGHGRSNAKAVHNAILRACEFCEAEVASRMERSLTELYEFRQGLVVDGETA